MVGGEGEVGLDDARIDAPHHWLWQVGLQPLPTARPPLFPLGNGADVEDLGDHGAQDAEGSPRVNCAVTLGGRGLVGLGTFHNHLHRLWRVKLQVVLATPGHQMVGLPPVGGVFPTRDEPNEGVCIIMVLMCSLSRLVLQSVVAVRP